MWSTILDTGYKIIKKSAETDQHLIHKNINKTFSVDYANLMEQNLIGVLDPIQGGGQKKNPTSFSPVTSKMVGISLQNFFTLILNAIAILV